MKNHAIRYGMLVLTKRFLSYLLSPLGLKVLVGAALIAAAWFLIVKPRQEVGRLEREAAAEQLQRAELQSQALEVLAKAQRDVEVERAAAVDIVQRRAADRVERTQTIREVVRERASAEGDREVGPVLGAAIDAIRADQERR